MKKWLFNPFIYIAGTRALLIGVSAMLVTAIIAFYTHAHFDGVLDLHFGHISSMSTVFLEALIDWGCMVLVFYIAGLIASGSSIRFIDIAGTMALARWVMVFPAIIGFGIHVPATTPKTIDEIMSSITPSFIVLSLFGLLFIIWMVALMYNAFSVSCNLKGSKAALSFIAGVIVAEIISKVIFHFIF